MHEASYREYAEGGTEAHRTWQGRSLFGIEYYDHRQGKPIERLHGYTLGQINLNGRNKAKLIFCPREVRKQGHDRNFIPDFFCKLDEKTLHTNPKELTLLQQYENDLEEENDNGSQDINRDNYQEFKDFKVMVNEMIIESIFLVVTTFDESNVEAGANKKTKIKQI